MVGLEWFGYKRAVVEHDVIVICLFEVYVLYIVYILIYFVYIAISVRWSNFASMLIWFRSERFCACSIRCLYVRAAG